MSAEGFFRFPDPVNEYAARSVAAGVCALGGLYFLSGWQWLLVPLTYGFLARVSTGPRFSPLGQFATKVAAPRLGTRNVPGTPKRFAQGVGLAFTGSATVLSLVFGQVGAAQVLIGVLMVCAGLEAGIGLCVGCKAFALLTRIGVIPESMCVECNDISARVHAA